MTTHSLQFVFNKTLYRGWLTKDLIDMTHDQAIDEARKMIDENPMIDEVNLWYDGDKIYTKNDVYEMIFNEVTK